MKRNIKLKAETVRKIGKRYGIDQTILDSLWPPHEETTNVDDVEAFAVARSTEADRRGLVRFFKDLDKLGYGRFVTGRRGNKSRFEWGLDVLQHVQDLETSRTSDTDETYPEIISHTFILRRDFRVDIELPADMTQAEAKRLAMFIGSLPFGEDQLE